MRIQTKLKYLLGIYFILIISLLLCMIATPMLIQKELPVTQRFIIAEDTFESLLILMLLSISIYIFNHFRKALKSYRFIADQVGMEKSRLTSRLSEAFNYIGTVNVEIKQIHSILNSVEDYPRTKKEFRSLMKRLTVKLRSFTDSPWIVVRLIDRRCGRTITEYLEKDPKWNLQPSLVSNRAIMERRHIDGVRTVFSSQRNLGFQTVCILPDILLSEEALMLITALANQIEMFFLLISTNEVRHNFLTQQSEKELNHDIYC